MQEFSDPGDKFFTGCGQRAAKVDLPDAAA